MPFQTYFLNHSMKVDVCTQTGDDEDNLCENFCVGKCHNDMICPKTHNKCRHGTMTCDIKECKFGHDLRYCDRIVIKAMLDEYKDDILNGNIPKIYPDRVFCEKYCIGVCENPNVCNKKHNKCIHGSLTCNNSNCKFGHSLPVEKRREVFRIKQEYRELLRNENCNCAPRTTITISDVANVDSLLSKTKI